MSQSQNQLILNYLKRGNSITPIEALEKYGCFRLSARIYDLKLQGHDILKQNVQNFDKTKTYAKYTLIKSASNEVKNVR